MQVEPLLGTDGVHHVEHGHRAVLHGDAGVLGMRAFVVDRGPHQAGEEGRGGRAVINGRDWRGAAAVPPGPRAGHGHVVVIARIDAFAMAAGAQAGVQVDPGNVRRTRAVLAQHLAQRAVAPRGLGAAKEDPLRKLVLALRDGGLPCRLALGGDVLLHGGHVVGAGWPLLGQQQGLHLAVGSVHGQGP
ncbi:hypothetical protein D3C71_1038330 [compost metagenome]